MVESRDQAYTQCMFEGGEVKQGKRETKKNRRQRELEEYQATSD